MKLSPTLRPLGGMLVGLVVAALVVLAARNGLLDRPELWSQDLKFAVRGQQPLDPRITIIDLDDATLDRLGWPLERGLHASLVAAAAKHGAQGVLFDIIFADASREPEMDALLATVSGLGTDVVLASEFRFGGASGQVVESDRQVPGAVTVTGEAMALPEAKAVTLPCAALRDSKALLGHVQLDNSLDGTFRRVPLLVRYRDAIYPAAGLLLAMRAGGWKGEPLVYDRGLITAPGSGLAPIPVDDHGLAWINFRNTGDDLRAVPLLAVLEAVEAEGPEEDARGQPGIDLQELFKDRLVLVGPSAKSVGDRGPTPYLANTPLVLAHVNVVDNLLTGGFLRQPGRGLLLSLTLLCGALVGLLAGRWHRAGGALVTLLVMAALAVLGQLLFSAHGLLLPLAAPALAAALTYGAITPYNHYVRDADERLIRQAFARYVSREVLDQIVHRPDLLDVGGQKRTLTMLFSDIKGYTALSNSKSTDEIMALLNDYLENMVDVLFTHLGTVDKIMGDGIMAYFGDPMQDPDHALHAVQCGLAMEERLTNLREKWGATDVDLQIRVGVATGEVFVGNIGSRSHIERTVIGAAVNLASRLEANGRPGFTTMCDRTHDLLANRVSCQPVSLELKGFDDAVQAWEVAASGETAPPRDYARDHHRVALKLKVVVAHAGQRYEGRTRDISAGGILMYLDEPLPVDAAVAVYARMPSGKSQIPFRIDGTVVRVTPAEGDDKAQVALRFDEVTTDTEVSLQEVMGAILEAEWDDTTDVTEVTDSIGRKIYQARLSRELKELIESE